MLQRSNVWVILGMVGLAMGVSAQVSSRVNYQGGLTNANGDRLTGSHDLVFQLYDVATDGAPLWSEIHAGVNVQDGLFSVLLGPRHLPILS
jgi:hypothetical protein